jgi:hypothetical protein
VIVLSEIKPDDVFKIHPRIMWATYARSYGETVFSQVRPGVESKASDEADRSILQNALEFWRSGLSERYAPGENTKRVESVIINFEKSSVLWMAVRNGYLTVSVERTGERGAYDVFQEIEKSLKRLS